jgi:quercetin dioxygenase-like cupin family protein
MTDETADSVQMIGARVRFVSVVEGAAYELSEWELDSGAPGPPVHMHRGHDEGFYVTAGRVGFSLDGATIYAETGAHVLAPKGHAHTYWNAAAEPARFLLIVSPPGLEGYFRALAAALVGVDSPEGSIAARKSLEGRYDMEMAGSPTGHDRQAADSA